MELNTEYIDEHYIEIYERIYTEPVLMPKLITKNTSRDIINISYRLVFKFQDIKIPEDVVDIKNKKRAEIRKFEEDALNSNSKEDASKLIYDFHKKELLEFLNLYPEYEDIVLDSGLTGKFRKFLRK